MPTDSTNSAKKKKDRWADSSSGESSSDDRNDDRKKKKKKRETATTTPGGADSFAAADATAPAASAAGGSPPVPPSVPLRLHNPLLRGCRSVYHQYERLARISEGTYGVVWKARDLASEERVALKQIKFGVDSSKQGFPLTAFREIQVLLELQHHSIVSVREVVVGTESVYLVMPLFEFDLKEGLEKFEGPLFQSELKGILQQVFHGLEYMHSKWYLHRDMKPSNILVHRSGQVALADFGLARQYQLPFSALTQLVCTLWYRPPELLFGLARYGPAVDLWGVGCVMGELIQKDPILQGQGELDQIDKIFEMVGTPTSDNWPSFERLPNAQMFRWKPRHQKELLLLPQKFRPRSAVLGSTTNPNQAVLDANGYDLLEQLLTLDPDRRITAQQALQHSYFKEGVQPQIPRFFSTST